MRPWVWVPMEPTNSEPATVTARNETGGNLIQMYGITGKAQAAHRWVDSEIGSVGLMAFLARTGWPGRAVAQDRLHIEFSSKIWIRRGRAPWYFVTVTQRACAELKCS